MAADGKKRPARVPLSAEEVAQFILVKKIREAKKLAKYKQTTSYKANNIFNIVCFFIYCEIVLCFFGFCHYQTHYSTKINVKYGKGVNAFGNRIVSEVDVTGVNGSEYTFVVDDYLTSIPVKYSSYKIGKDYLLQKELKGILNGSGTSFTIYAANSILFVLFLIMFISCIAFFYNLNENPYSLNALSVLNFIGLAVILLL
jgi:hypothetical protein